MRFRWWKMFHQKHLHKSKRLPACDARMSPPRQRILSRVGVKTRAGKHFNGYFDRKLRNGREIFLSTSKLVFRREKKWPANKMAKMPIYWHFWKSGYCTFPMKTNDTAEIRRTHRWIICMFKVLPTFRSGSNSTYTPRKSHSERPVTHGTHFFGIYTKNRADRCSRVVEERCNTPSPEIPKYDNTPPYKEM